MDKETVFIPCKTQLGHYTILPNDMNYTDLDLSKHIKMGLFEFRYRMVKEYNALLDLTIERLCFETKEDCQKAIDWIYSMRVMRKLQEANKPKEIVDNPWDLVGVLG